MFIWLIRGRPNIFAFSAHLYQKNIRRKLPPGLVGFAWHIIITYQDFARFEEWGPTSGHGGGGRVCACVELFQLLNTLLDTLNEQLSFSLK